MWIRGLMPAALALPLLLSTGPSHAATLPSGPRRALVIGVNRYPKANSLAHAESDAAHFCRMLSNPGVGSVNPQDVTVLTTAEGTPARALPSRDNILRALDQLAARPQHGGTLWFYFSGHGVELDQCSQIVPEDTDPSAPLRDQVIPVREIRNRLVRACPDGTIVIVLDSCHSGSPRGLKLLDVLQRSTGGTATRANIITVAAADVNETALEVGAPPGGVFTYFLVRGLTGDADENQDGAVTASEAMSYVSSRVRGFAQRVGGSPQTPQFILATGHDVVLTSSSRPTLDQIETLAADAPVAPGAILPTGVVLAIDGDHENLILRTLSTVIPDSEFRLVNPTATATMAAIATVLGPARERQSQLALGARYLAIVQATATTQFYSETGSYKCVASALLQVFDEAGRQVGSVQREAMRPAFNEQEAIRRALRDVCAQLAGTGGNSPLVSALQGVRVP